MQLSSALVSRSLRNRSCYRRTEIEMLKLWQSVYISNFEKLVPIEVKICQGFPAISVNKNSGGIVLGLLQVSLGKVDKLDLISCGT